MAVTNRGAVPKTIRNHYIDTKPSNLILVEPKEPKLTVPSMQSVVFRFSFKKDLVGYFEEAFILDFPEFQIGRLLKWEVTCPEFQNLAPAKDKTDKFYEQSRQQRAQQYLLVQESQ